MDDSIKIQEEFEKLIDQLERLKNINDQTSVNTESAQKVFKQIDKFVMSTNEYKKKLEQDLNTKSQSIDNLILKLEKSIESFDQHTGELKQIINSEFNGLKNEVMSNFSLLSEAVSNKMGLLQVSFTDLKSDIIVKVEKIETSLIEQYVEQIDSLTLKINENNSIITKKIETQEKELGSLKTLLYLIIGLIVFGGFCAIVILFKKYR